MTTPATQAPPAPPDPFRPWSPAEFSAWRARLGWPIDRASAAIGIRQSTLRQYERGARYGSELPVRPPLYVRLACERVEQLAAEGAYPPYDPGLQQRRSLEALRAWQRTPQALRSRQREALLALCRHGCWSPDCAWSIWRPAQMHTVLGSLARRGLVWRDAKHGTYTPTAEGHRIAAALAGA